MVVQKLLSLVTLLAILLLESTAVASIIVPGQPRFGLEFGDFLELDDTDEPELTSESTSSGPVNDEQLPAEPVDVEPDSPTCALPVDGSSSGASSSGAGSGAYCVAFGAARIPQDRSVTRWVGEISLALLDPPLSSLIRPPQS